VTGLYGVMTLGGWPEGLATTFFGFFFSLPRASRLPMKYSSPYFDAGFSVLVPCNPASPRNPVGDDFRESIDAVGAILLDGIHFSSRYVKFL
jgi:hypothetical protein